MLTRALLDHLNDRGATRLASAVRDASEVGTLRGIVGWVITKRPPSENRWERILLDGLPE